MGDNTTTITTTTTTATTTIQQQEATQQQQQQIITNLQNEIQQLQESYRVAEDWMSMAVQRNNELQASNERYIEQIQLLEKNKSEEEENVIKNEVVKTTTEEHNQLLEKYTLLQNENEILKTNIKQMEEEKE